MRPDDEHSEPKAIDKTPTRERMLRLFRYARPYFGRLAIALGCLFGASGLGLVYPAYFGRLVDAAFTDRDLSALHRHALLLILVFAAQAAFVFFRHYLMTWVGERVVADLRVEIFDHLTRLPQAYFHRKRTGELLSRLSDDVTRLQGTVGEDLSMTLRNVVTLIGGIAILFWQNPFLTAVMIAVVPPIAVGSTLWGRVIRKLSRTAQDELAAASADLQEGISGIETVQAFTREGYELGRYRGAIDRTFALFVRQALARSWLWSTSQFLGFGAIAGIFWLGGQMVAQGEISAGELTSFLMYTMLVAGAVGGVAGLWSRFQATIGATARIFEILDTRSDIVEPEHPERLGRVEGRVAFEGVTFSYGDRSTTVLSQVSFVVPAGRVCAVVGPSGSGKTTLGRLLLRFYDPGEGRVTVDGVDVRRLALSDLRGQIAVVSQDPVLFSGSIRENIRYGRLEASDAEVEAAARAANADGFVRAFPAGYDTRVGERGVKLSGGQRQRVSIARALLRDPRILILDEATSALDAESEHLVQQALERLQEGRTTLVIAHRLSTIRDADTIVVLENGRVVEEGRHNDLMAADGVYARLVARQTEPSPVVA